MKIAKGDVTITDIPVFESITIRTLIGDPETVVALFDDDNTAYTYAELTELQETISAVLQVMREMGRATADPTVGALRTWPRASAAPEPLDVTRVRDRDDDIWTKGGRVWRLTGESDGRSWEWLVENYGPLTEVLS